MEPDRLTKNNSMPFLQGGGEMGALIRSISWHTTPLGDPQNWPVSLKTAASIMLATPTPMLICWGANYIQLYNDAFRPILGATKHPQAMGISASETYAEIWETIGPMFAGVMEGQAVGFPDFMVPLDRNGYMEDCYFDFSYSPVKDETGCTNGVLVICIETTEKIRSNDRLKKSNLQLKAALEAEEQARKNIEESEERFLIMAESTDIFIAVADETSNAVYFNKAWIDLTGRPTKDLLKFGWTGLVHPEDKEQFLDIYLSAFKKQQPFTGEFRILNKQGDYRWLLVSGPPRFRPDGSFAGYISSGIDITYRKNSETEQAMLAAIIESSEDAIISKTLNGIITSWNQAAEKLFGHTANEAVGKHISIIIPPERLKEEQLIIEKVRNSEKLDHFETIRITKSGQRVPISLTVSPIHNSRGQVIGASKMARDISRQKHAEDLLQGYAVNLEILNTVGKVISEDLDLQSILQKVTDATTKLTGAAFGAFFHNQVDEKGESYMLYTLSGAPREAFEKFGMPRNTAVFAPTFNGEGIVRIDDITKDPRYGKNSPHKGMPKGHLPVVSYLAVPVVSKSGKVVGGLFFGHPEPGKFTEEHEKLLSGVSAQAAVALDNAKLYGEIKILNAKKDEFIGLASHELKTPVTSINGYLQIIERSLADDDRIKAFVTKARYQVDKLVALISDLLDVSKIQTGKLPILFDNFDLHILLTEVADVMQQTNPSHRLELEVAAGPLMVYADQQRIEQVIINLISNAIKYSAGADCVIVRASATARALTVAVQDFGIGIATDQLGRIFSRFYRVENLAPHISGLGIGLFISKEIIERHNGKLWVESEPGKGSTFYFSLPV